MTDKYEEFKKWFELQPSILQIVTSIESDGFETKAETENIFEAFEKELEEKQKEEKVKEIIRDLIVTTPLTSTSLPKPHELYCSDKLVDNLFNELKGEGLLK